MNVDRKYRTYSDLEGHKTPDGGTIPPEICITPQKPDLVVIDETTKTINLFELTVPDIRNINIRNKDKEDRYTHFLTDMTGYKCYLTCFEISTLGYISERNMSNLHTLHKFMKPGIKLSKFKQNISALSVYSSFHIFLCRKEQTFFQPPYLSPPFEDRSRPNTGPGQ